MYIRGFGHAGGTESLSGDWWKAGEGYWNNPWEALDASRTARIDATLEAMKTTYKSNTVREFVCLNWWWIDHYEANHYLYQSNAISYRDYIELLIQRAALKNMYIAIVPYSILSYPDGSGAGLPLAAGGMDSASIAFLNTIYSGDPTYLQPMRLWWTSVVNRLGSHPNVIFELWNEPDGSDTVKTQWLTHCKEMYKTIRSLGDNHIIFMQWRMGTAPGSSGYQLEWVPTLYNLIRNDIGGEPTNIVYTFHAYRYVWINGYGTTYTAVLSELSLAKMVPISRTGGLDVPLVCGESGPGMELTGSALTDELGWWDGIVRACRDLDIGFIAYYWLPRVGWAPDEALIGTWSSGLIAPPPSASGQIWINSYISPVPKHNLVINSTPQGVPFNIVRLA